MLAWLAELAQTAVQQWGYRVLKLDFLYAAALPGVRHDAGATRAQALRRGLQAIRDGAGDAFLLGCGCPFGPAVGLVDGMRIGLDGPAAGGPTRTEVLVTTALHNGSQYHARTADVYYIAREDAVLYQGEAKPVPTPLRQWNVVGD